MPRFTDPANGSSFNRWTVDGVHRSQVCLLQFLSIELIDGDNRWIIVDPNWRRPDSTRSVILKDIPVHIHSYSFKNIPSKIIFLPLFLCFIRKTQTPISLLLQNKNPSNFPNFLFLKFSFLSIVLQPMIKFGRVRYCLKVHLPTTALWIKGISSFFNFEFSFIIV